MKTLILITALALTGCGTTYSGTTTSSTTQYIRDTRGQTQARIQDGNVYTTQGIRTHRIDSQGNIYSVRGATAGQRVGRVGK